MKILSCVAFLLIISLPSLKLLLGFYDSGSRSLREQRQTMELSDINFRNIWQLPSDFDAYFKDNFGFRSLLIRTANSLRFHFFDVSPHRRVLVGKEGWLFYGQKNLRDFYQGRNLFSQQEIDKLRTIYKARAKYLNQMGINYLIVSVPSKESVYPEYYSPRFRKISETNRFLQFVEEVAQEVDIPVLDLTPRLLEAKSRYDEPLYIKTDSHWNDLGAYEGYLEIIENLRQHYPDLDPLSLNDFQRADRMAPGGFGSMLGIFYRPQANIATLTPSEPDTALQTARRERRRKINETHGVKNKVPVIVRRLKEDPHVSVGKTFVYRNSFFNRLIKFYSRHFEIGYYFPDAHFSFDPVKIWKKKPDLVIEQITDHAIKVPRQRAWHLLNMPRVRKLFKESDKLQKPESVIWQGVADGVIDIHDKSQTSIELSEDSHIQAIAEIPFLEEKDSTLVKIKVRSQVEGKILLSAKQEQQREYEAVYPIAASKCNNYYIELAQGDFDTNFTLEVTLLEGGRIILEPILVH